MKRSIILLALVLALNPARADASVSVPALNKIDPLLVPLLSRSIRELPRLHRLLAPGGLPVLVRTEGDPRQLERFGVRIRTVVGPIASGELDPEALRGLLEHPALLYIEGPYRMRPAAPMLDQSIPFLGVDSLRRSQPSYTGNGVVIGFIDTGIDPTHPGFERADGSTRIVRIWDQIASNVGRAPADFGYGSEWTAEDVDAGVVSSVDVDGHGTHVAGSAAGNGRTDDGRNARSHSSAQYVGVAPEAELIMVRTTYLTPHILDAVVYILDRAAQLGRPVVVNMSFGNSRGPHDGRGLVQEALQLLVEGSVGVGLVASAGNDGGRPLHARINLREGDPPRRLYFRSAFTGDGVTVESWLAASDDVRVRPLYPSGIPGAWTDFGVGLVFPGDVVGLIVPDGPARGVDSGVAYVPSPALFSDQSQIVVAYGRGGDNAVALDASVYAIEFEGAGMVDAYVQNGEFVEMSVDPDAVFPDDQYMISTPSEADLVLSVGSVRSSNLWQRHDGVFEVRGALTIGERSEFSSIGPRRDEAEKPDVLAPGEFIGSALGGDALPIATSSRVTPDARYVVSLGTSVATAHVSGLVALLLEQDASMSAEAIYQRVRETGRDGFWTADNGRGVVDAHALLNVPTPPDGLRIETGPSGRELVWDPNTETDVVAYRVTVGDDVMDVGSATRFVLPMLAAETEISVTAVDRVSGPSASIRVSQEGVRLGPPDDVRLLNLDAGVSITWQPVAGASEYHVNWGFGENSQPNVLDTPGTRATIRSLWNGLVIFVSVSAVDADGVDGVRSEVMRGTPRGATELPTPTLALRDGFPISTGHDVLAPTAAADLDGDGTLEIIVGGVDGNVYVWRHDGKRVPGWPIDVGEPVVDAAAVGNVGSDGTIAVFVAAGRHVYAWDGGGRILPGFPVTTPDVVRAHPVLVDVDGDRALDVLVSVAEGEAGVYAWDSSGDPLPAFPMLVDPGSFIYTSPVVADADFDGRLEVYLTTFAGPVYSWSADGEIRDGFPALPGGGAPAHATPTVVARDHDSMDIVLSGHNAGLTVIDAGGNLRAGFPAWLVGESDAPVSFGDVDGDGAVELIASNTDGLVFEITGAGDSVDRFPIKVTDEVRSTVFSADLDGDGTAELIIAAGGSGNSGSIVTVLRGDGSVMDYATTDANVAGTLTLADLDGDGLLELVDATLREEGDPVDQDQVPAVGGRVYVWNLPYASHGVSWTTHQGDVARTGIARLNMPDPSDLSRFEGVWHGDGLELRWVTTRERGNVGWLVLRATSADGPFSPTGPTLVPSRGGRRDAETEYVTVDARANPNAAHYYRLVNYGTMGRSTTSAVIEVAPRPASVGPDGSDGLLTQWGRVKGVRMLAPYPSPANPEVWLPFLLGSAADVDVTIYDVLGNAFGPCGWACSNPAPTSVARGPRTGTAGTQAASRSRAAVTSRRLPPGQRPGPGGKSWC